MCFLGPTVHGKNTPVPLRGAFLPGPTTIALRGATITTGLWRANPHAAGITR